MSDAVAGIKLTGRQARAGDPGEASALHPCPRRTGHP